jgi:phosphoribosylformylglycinamidine synthase PurS subunit
MKYSAQITVTFRNGVPDMPGRGIFNTLRSLGPAIGFEGILNIRSGKIIEFEIEHDARDGREIDEVINDMCEQLLVHRVAEDYTFRLVAHSVQADSSVIKMPLAPWTPYKVADEEFFAPTGEELPE